MASPTHLFSREELLLISQSPLQRLKLRLVEDFPHVQEVDNFESFIATERCRDPLEFTLESLKRTKLAQSNVRVHSSSLGDRIRTLLSHFDHWPKILKAQPTLIRPCSDLLRTALHPTTEDPAIWAALYDLLDRFDISNRPTTPPVASPATTFDTPARPNSSTPLNNSQKHQSIDPYLRAEIRDSVWKNVSGFEGYFLGIDRLMWNCATKCLNDCVTGCGANWEVNHWTDAAAEHIDPWPQDSPEPIVVQWLQRLVSFASPQGQLGPTMFYASGKTPLLGTKCVRQCDVFLSRELINGGTAHGRQHRWVDVLVPGELKSNPREDANGQTVLQLAGYAREVFGAQVARRFVHAFTICGDLMRLYLFDRAGVSCSEAIRISKSTKSLRLCVRILLSYATMDAIQIGFDPNYKSDPHTVFFPQGEQTTPSFFVFRRRTYRLHDILFYLPAIISRGTLCWRATDVETGEECAVKDAWRSKFRKPEGEFWDEARKMGVWGSLECRQHGDVVIDGKVDEIASLVRMELDYKEAKRVAFGKTKMEGMLHLSANSEDLGAGRCGKLALDQSVANSSNTAKRRLPGHLQMGELQSLKRRKQLDKQRSGNLDFDDDRVHTIHIFYRVGERIDKFRSVPHLLEAFHDAIKCHRSLLESNILHRDISVNNIMIAPQQNPDGPRGFLIDLDLAKFVDSTLPSGAPHRTGTVEFMAIGILRGDALHSWRHDLESFFYVFIWICVLYDGAGHVRKPRSKALDGWSSMNAADIKVGQMALTNQFEENILDHFDESFANLKELTRRWRQILFSRVAGEVYLSTPVDHASVYEEVLRLFIS